MLSEYAIKIPKIFRALQVLDFDLEKNGVAKRKRGGGNANF